MEGTVLHTEEDQKYEKLVGAGKKKKKYKQPTEVKRPEVEKLNGYK